MLHSRRPQVAEQLSSVFVQQSAAGFQFDYQALFQNQISGELTEESSIFIEDLQRCLLLKLNALLAKSMSQGILVYFLKMPMPEIRMNRERRFAHHIAQPHNVLHSFFCAFWWLCLELLMPKLQHQQIPELKRIVSL